MARERRVGIMTLVHGQRGYYPSQRVEVAMAFAAQAAVAIENARLFAAEGERVEQLRVINQVSQSIAGILDLDGLLRQTAALIHQRFGYYHVGIALSLIHISRTPTAPPSPTSPPPRRPRPTRRRGR